MAVVVLDQGRLLDCSRLGVFVDSPAIRLLTRGHQKLHGSSNNAWRCRSQPRSPWYTLPPTLTWSVFQTKRSTGVWFQQDAPDSGSLSRRQLGPTLQLLGRLAGAGGPSSYDAVHLE